MNKAHIKLLQDRYIEAVNGYVAAYNDKHHCCPVGWLHGHIGGVLVYEGGKRIDFRDIMSDINNDLPVHHDCLAATTDEIDFVHGKEAEE